MDYQGNYFTEEHDENESKVYRVVKNTVKWTMYGLSFLLYAVLFYVIVTNRDSYILEKNYMGELPEFENVDTDDIELYRINTRVFMNDDGSIQLHHIDYSEEKGILEIGIKYNANKITKGEYGDSVEYVLTDSNGRRYPRAKHIVDNNGRYGFARVCFTGLDIDFDENDLHQENQSKNPNGKGTLYQLTLYRKSDGYKLHTFNIYDNTMTFYSTDYDN